jgi:hypothetical protein
MRGCSSTIAEVHSDVEAAKLCFVISANSERTFPPVAPEGLMPTDPAGLVSQLEGARGTKLDPVILVRVRRSLHGGDRQSYQATAMLSSGSHATRCWRKPDSNSWSRFEKSPPYKTRYTESESFGRRERHHSGGTKS